jgi:hypothetical protein
LLWLRLTTPRALTSTPPDCTAGTGRPHRPLVVREPEPYWWAERAGVTVAAIHETEAAGHPETVTANLAALAADQELLIVLGSNARSVQHTLAADLRASLPRHTIVVMRARHRHSELVQDAAMVERLLNIGALPIVITPISALLDVTAEITSYLRADRVLRVLPTVDGTKLCEIWQRPEPNPN